MMRKHIPHAIQEPLPSAPCRSGCSPHAVAESPSSGCTVPPNRSTHLSAIAKHVATKCAQRGELAGSFFFSSEFARPKQNSIIHFVPTLALQLMLSPLRGFQPGLLKALLEDPFVIRRAIPTQVERLLLEPLQGVTSGPFLVVIDALDQCEAEENQYEVLTQLARIAQGLQNPLRFIVTSSSAPHFRHYFKSNKLAVSSRVDVLEDSLRQVANAGLFEAHKLVDRITSTSFVERRPTASKFTLALPYIQFFFLISGTIPRQIAFNLFELTPALPFFFVPTY
ncbi:hypothetical protein DXG01_009624 [Tephrocybe rancida]|nr:hypothetical protein DXG01_009624 [Tephrocybe rancida]